MTWIRCLFGFSLVLNQLVLAQTEVFFTKPVDLRYAWLNNDAQGEANFPALILSQINGATQTLDVATMSFSTQDAIADALVNRAAAGVDVRLLVNRGHRLQDGTLRALRGNIAIADNNLPALITRINFKQPGGTTPPGGWLDDTGSTFGPKAGGFSYGWDSNVAASMRAPNAGEAALYPSSLLGHCFARPNNGFNTWEIALPNGAYYVHLVVGEASFNSKNYIQVEGQNVFKFGATFGQYHNCGSGEFKGCLVEGDAEDGVANSKLVTVSDGRLSIRVGEPGQVSYSSICYVEIYRGDAGQPLGNNFSNADRVQRYGLHHSKYLVSDSATANRTLWMSSGNLSSSINPGGRSEDAVRTDNSGLVNAFQQQFNQNWGSANPDPNPAMSHFSRFKNTPSTTIMVSNPLLGASYAWQAVFSPSVGGFDISSELASTINGTEQDWLMLMEQFNNSGPAYGMNSSGYLMNVSLINQLSLGRSLYGVFGNLLDLTIDTVYDAYPNAHVVLLDEMHHKVFLRDTLYDTRFRQTGMVGMGSMNWSQSGMLRNDEASFWISDPAIANQYLQRAMNEMATQGIEPDPRVDVVLVLDRSLSMTALCADGSTTLLEASKMGASIFLDLLDEDAGHRVSLVRFGTTVEPFAPPIHLDPFDATHHAGLTTGITNTVATAPIGNATCYGAALDECRIQLDDSDKRPRQIIHFFTDGKQNMVPWAEDILPMLISDGVEIHSTAFSAFDIFGGAVTPILETMASQTGGSFAQVDALPLDLRKRFLEVASVAMGLDALLDPSYWVSPQNPAKETFAVDPTAQTLAVVTAWAKPDLEQARAQLSTPDGKTVDETWPGVQVLRREGHEMWKLDLHKLQSWGMRTEGLWTVVMAAGPKFRGRESMQVELMVYADTELDLRSEVANNPKYPDRITLLARMLFKGQPVNQTRVRATWRFPQIDPKIPAQTKQIYLYDDGKHGDGRANDGVFGLNLTIREPGNHQFHVIAEGQPKGLEDLHRRETHTAYLSSIKQ
ncbi:MAG: VWA domain-containing protein [Acidobacteria bacterium]|nr:VWA domain-containing protein [Acidobacteriota bacterium]MCB9398497.1 VWA domain-containing protein [Acidobacteriota bacterium]